MVRRRERCMPPVPKIEEPVKKKPKVDGEEDSDDSEDGDSNLAIVQRNLLDNCLCPVPENLLYKLFQRENGTFEISSWDFERTLKFLSYVHVLCEVSLRQTSDGVICSRINEVCDALVRNEHGVVEQVIDSLAHSNQTVGFSACKALSSFLLVCRSGVETKWLDRITEHAVTTAVPRHMCTTLDVLKRVVDWKDKSPHPLEAGVGDNVIHPNCHTTSLMDTESPDSSEVKCICIKVLKSKWPVLVQKVDGMISVYSPDYECAVVTFLGLWESIISVKTNLSVVDTTPFYLNLASFVSVLNASVPSSVWKHVLNLLNEVLCYGSTLALQDCLPEEPCALAHHIMRSVKDWQLLDVLPYSNETGGFTGSSGSTGPNVGDRTLIQKMALLVLKSVAVTVKETRYESSSDSSVGSEADDVDSDMALIERSIREVVRQLDICIKARLPFHPSMPISQWVVQLFADQDDALIEAMVCCLDVSMGLYHRPTTLQTPNPASAPAPALSPTNTFISFLQVVSHDPELLLDLLVSNETCFLLYLLRILKFIRRHWEEFVHDAGRQLEQTMTVLIRLRLALDRLVQSALFPYNIGPVLRLLEKVEEFYEGGPSEH